MPNFEGLFFPSLGPSINYVSMAEGEGCSKMLTDAQLEEEGTSEMLTWAYEKPLIWSNLEIEFINKKLLQKYVGNTKHSILSFMHKNWV